MKIITLGHIAISTLAIFAACHVQAAPVTLLEDKRQVHYFGEDMLEGPFDYTYIPAPPFSDFDVFGQESSVSETAMSGSGMTKADGFNSPYRLISKFEIDFAVTGEVLLDISGHMDAIGEFGEDPYSSSSIYLFNESGPNIYIAQVLSFEASESDYLNDGVETVDFAEQILLGPGNYSLRVNSNANFWSYTTWSFDATFTSVPLPSAFWLFGSGLLWLGTAKQRGQS